MREAVCTDAGGLEDEPRVERGLEPLQAARGLARLRAREQGEREVAAEAGGELERRSRLVGQGLQPPRDDVPDASRDPGVQRAALLVEQPLAAQEPDELVHEEGVSLGARVDGEDEAGVRRERADGAHELGDRLHLEPAERQVADPRMARDVAAGVRQGGVGGRALAHRDEREDRQVDDPRREELEQVHARGVGPVRVVEDEEQRLPARRPCKQPDRLLVEAEARVALGRRPLARRRQLRQELGELGRVEQEPVLLREQSGRRPQDRQPGPERRRALALEAGAEEEGAAAGDRLPPRLERQPALPDSRLALDEHDAAVPGDRRLQRLHERAELTAAAGERRAAGVDADRLLLRRLDRRRRRGGRSRGRWRWGRWRWRWRRCRGEGSPVELRVLVEDLRLEPAERRRGVDAELVAEDHARLPDHLERVCLPAAAVERQRELSADALVELLLRNEPLQVWHELGMGAEGESCFEAVGAGGGAQPLEPVRLVLGPALVRELGVGGAAPERKRRAEEPDRLRVAALPESPAALRGERLEAHGVDLGRVDREAVAARLRHEQLAIAERAPEPRDVRLQRPGGRRRRASPPERVQEHVRRHHLPAREREHRQERALLAAPERQRLAVAGGLHRPQDKDADALLCALHRPRGHRTSGFPRRTTNAGAMERNWWTLVAVCVGVFMLLIDITVVNMALPSIQKSLHGSFTDLQWVVDAYALALATFVLTAGSAGDLFGRKRVFMTGIVLFTSASALCGAAPDPPSSTSRAASRASAARSCSRRRSRSSPRSSPMIDLRLFRKPAFTGVQIAAFAISASLFSMFLYLTLYMQQVLGFSPIAAGIRFLPMSLLAFVAAPIGGKLSERVPVRFLMDVRLLVPFVGLGHFLPSTLRPRPIPQ